MIDDDRIDNGEQSHTAEHAGCIVFEGRHPARRIRGSIESSRPYRELWLV